MALTGNRQGSKGDALAALLLAVLLSVVWTLRDWHNLSALRLPDTDDIMRLQQIRDWLDGQRFYDPAQHRLGAPPGLAMHWSRLPDIVPAAIIAGLEPLVGRHAGEIAAVIAWPAMLYATALFVITRIARLLDAEIARTALIVAAIAYPSSTIFLPGRIDHHGLQIVLLLVMVHALINRPGFASGVIAGVAAAASVAVGMETTPLIFVAGGVIVVRWIRNFADETLTGFGIALSAALAAAAILLRNDQWLYPACDAFTAITWRAAQCVAALPILLAIAGRATTRSGVRAVLAVAAGAIIAIMLWYSAPQCLSPYGGVDPLLMRLWMRNVAEAQSLFRAPLTPVIGYAGLMSAGIAAGLWRLYVTRAPSWAILLAFQLGALALTCVQLRGAYAGAILAAPALASVIKEARRRGTGFLALAWIGSAGMLYPMAAAAFAPAAVGAPAVSSCTTPEALARFTPLRGRLLAPLDLGAFALGASRLSVVGGPYHRNNAGNTAVYRFFLGSPAAAREIARRWQVDYIALCDDSLGELGPAFIADRRRLIGALRSGHPPDWLTPIPGDHGISLFSVDLPRKAGQ